MSSAKTVERAGRLLGVAEVELARGDRKGAIRAALRSEKLVNDEQRVTLALILAEAGAVAKAREIAWTLRNPEMKRQIVLVLCPAEVA